MTKNFSKLLTISLLYLFALSCAQNGKRLHISLEDVPFNMPELTAPAIPSNEVVLTDFGAIGDGETLCTEAFEKAFAKLESLGGGRLIVPDGVWFTGPVGLRPRLPSKAVLPCLHVKRV